MDSTEHRIALIVDNCYGNYQVPLNRELKKVAKQQGCQLVIFEGRPLSSELLNEKRHNKVYQHIKPQQFDGILTLSPCLFSYCSKHIAEDFMARLSVVPLVSLFQPYAGAHTVLIDNQSAMQAMVEHLIVEHSYQRIVFVTGPEGNVEAELRLQAYRQALSKHGLEVDKRYLFRGDFRPTSGARALQDIVDSGLAVDAIVFANDDMALGAWNYMNSQAPNLIGKYPMVGFDDMPSASLVSPALTTVRQPRAELAKQAFRLLLGDQQDTEQTVTLPAELVIRQSCGCEEEQPYDDIHMPYLQSSYHIFENIHALDRESLFRQLSTSLPSLHLRGCYLCLYPMPDLRLDDPIPEQCELVFAHQSGSRVYLPEPLAFASADLLPARFYDDVTVDYWLVRSLSINDQYMGYVVFDISEGQESEVELIRGFISLSLKVILSNEARDIAQQEAKDYLAQLEQVLASVTERNAQLQDLSVTDELTELDNRRGFKQKVRQRLQGLAPGETFTIVSIDFNGLKPINDTWGHAEGDKALMAMAQVLKSAFRRDDIVARLGGDEFVVFLAHCDQAQLELLNGRLVQEVNRFNTESEQAFSIDCAIGYVGDVLGEQPVDLDALMLESDRQLAYYKRQSQQMREWVKGSGKAKP
ncbi:diguanylate cyclase domain-containing protein [Aliagarivorans taiwanensis]|uniref:diguanylate cyclase domain-containing protein n=1 Tax=Aliagarivorans taiwanensis TaxID=561966 RepID=UPI000A05D203|nr:GGDEF domain-containing protein [Aliagarivorans taiwanensis]